ncbi:hypothetical protein JW921_05550 [Candidatus Fermentibacterales bacterium]|nr:hypothetical protein [Candidatus Fermentibacterales bacterium]
MKLLSLVLASLFLASVAFAAPGDVLRSSTVSGQPSYGIRGMARDWDTDELWVAGPAGSNNVRFTSIDIVTLAPGTWQQAMSMGWVFDIGYGYDVGGTKYLLMNDQYSPYTKIIDPADGSYEGNLPDYYSSAQYTDGCGIDWNTNYVYISSYGSADCVYYDGSSWSVFTTISGALNMGVAVGWDHVFFLRTSTYYTIEVYQIDGTFVESIPLNGWSSGWYVMGAACGQVDIAGDNESLFICDFITLQVHEIEVGDYAGEALQESTWGEIKTVFSN